MAQNGFVFRKGNSWFLRYRHDVEIDGVMVRKQKCVKLADYCDRFRCESDLEELAKAEMDKVYQERKCPQAGRMFTTYVEKTYLPHALQATKPSTYAGRKSYWLRYIKPHVAELAVRDFSTATIYRLLEKVSSEHKLNYSTVAKIHSILYAMFKLAINIGEFPEGRENPVADAMIPRSAMAKSPKATVASTREEVQTILVALKGKPLARAAVGIVAFTGVRPGEARGLRWEEWNRVEKHIAVNRSVWHREIGTTKTEQSVRFVAVADELREILLDLWNAKGSPISGYVLAAGKKDHPVILDNLAKRIIRPALEEAKIEWHGWYSLRRFHGTQVRMKSNSETGAKALGNSKAVFDKHYLKPTAVLPDVRRAVNDAVSGLVQ